MRRPLVLAAVAIVMYVACLALVFPGYFAPFVPHHSDMYIPVGLQQKPVTEVAGYPRPVANLMLQAMGLAGVTGSIVLVVALVLTGVITTGGLFSAGLAGMAFYSLVLFAHPEFYFQHRHDVPAALSYVLMLAAVVAADRWMRSGGRAKFAAFIGVVGALGLTKETYVPALLVLMVGVLGLRYAGAWRRIAVLAGMAALTLGGAMVFNIVRYRHFLASATQASQPYQISLAPTSLAQALGWYLTRLLSPASAALLGVAVLALWPDRRKLLLSLVAMLAGVAALLPHAALPNHLEDHYAWVAAPLAFAPLLLVEYRGRRGMVVSGLLAVLAGVYIWTNGPAYRSTQKTWTIAQERANAHIVASLDRVRALPESARHVLVTGLRTSYHPWLIPYFVEHEFGAHRQWTVLTPRDGPHAVIPPVTLTTPQGVNPAQFDAALVYDEDARLQRVLNPAQLRSGDSDGILLPQLGEYEGKTDLNSLLSTGIIYVEWGWPERGIGPLSKAAAESPSNPYPHYFLGQAQEAMGKPAEAAHEYEAALARDTAPGNPAFRQALQALRDQRR